MHAAHGHLASFLGVPAVCQGVGSVWQQQRAQEEHEGRHNGQTHGQAPPMGVHVLGAVVDPLGHPDAYRQGGLAVRWCCASADKAAAVGVSQGGQAWRRCSTP